MTKVLKRENFNIRNSTFYSRRPKRIQIKIICKRCDHLFFHFSKDRKKIPILGTIKVQGLNKEYYRRDPFYPFLRINYSFTNL